MTEHNLITILDSMAETEIYVLEQESHKLLYFNRNVKTKYPGIETGCKCHEIIGDRCMDCPLPAIGGRNSMQTIHYRNPLGQASVIRAEKAVWEDKIPAYIISVSPYQADMGERRSLKQIEKLYKQSLVTVFAECIIINLTQGHYVNCQKDSLWETMPQRGSYDAINSKYAKIAIHPADAESYIACFSRKGMQKQFAEGRQQFIKRFRRKMSDGTYHMVEYTAAMLDQVGEDSWAILLFRDSNEEYLQEQERNLELSQLATAARVSCQMLIAANLTKNSYYMMEYDRFATKKAARNGSFDELIEVGASTVDPAYREEFKRKFQRESLLQAFSRGIQNVTMELRQLGDDGLYHWNLTQVVRVYSPNTDDVLEITMTKDIDEERRRQEETLEKDRKTKKLLEEALQKAEDASRAKSDFLSRMSHDIRTPLNAVMGLTALARLHMDDREKVSEYLEKTEVSGAHLMELINEVLDVSKIESGREVLAEMECDLTEMLRETALMLQPSVQRRKQKLTVDIQEHTHTLVLGDEKKLRQVILNIMENASKYTPEEGRIEVSLKELEKDEKRVGKYQFVISDNGIGMKEEYLKHIFEPFSRADDSYILKTAGTGLGMTICRNLVTMMGGEIKVESRYMEGSRFIITLCLKELEAQEQKKTISVTESGSDFTGMRALIAEDNELNQEIAKEMLRYLGVEADVAENGREAVDRILGSPAGYYDVIFMDIQMPELNGYEAAAVIRGSGMEGTDKLPIIAMTADAFSEDIKKTRLAGMNGHMAKPISINWLKRILEYCCGLNKAEDESGS